MIHILVALTIFGAEDRATSIPPLTAQQTQRIQKLIRAVEQQDMHVRNHLVSLQRDLITAYADYELDERHIATLQDKIASLQRDLLKNYHRMQLELRRIVGPERFKVVKRRIDLHRRSKQMPDRQESKADGKAEGR